jgi:uncharacterized membrane protein YadS
MYQLSVLQNQWLILALFGGIILMLGFTATYLMMWRPRSPSAEPISGGRALIKWIPWFIIVLIAAIVIFQLTYAIVLHFYPPNI